MTTLLRPNPAGLSRWVAVALLGLAPALVRADTSSCETLYQSDDPALFKFVETRKALDYQRYAGRPIRNIDYQVLPVFNENNPNEDNWVYRSLNVLHIDTRHSTLKQQMIVQPGEALDPSRIRENERLLRRREYLIDAMIVPTQVCDDGIDLLVVVRDVWTFYPRTSASRSGGDNSVGAGVTELNLLGTGQNLSLRYSKDDERSGYGVSYRVPELFLPHLALGLDYYDNSDGQLVSGSLAKPFFELDSRWAAGMYYTQTQLDQTVDRNDKVINRYQQESLFQEVFGGWSTGRRDGVVHRWKVGYTEDRNEFSPADRDPSMPPGDVTLRYPWASWQFLEDRYWTTSNISRSHRQEDILLGLQTDLKLGYSDTGLGASRDAVVYSAFASHTASAGDHHLLRSSVDVSGHYDTDDHTAQETLYGIAFRYYKFIDNRNRWYARVHFRGTHNARDDQLLSGGGNETLRGYPTDIQRGNRQWLLTVERRHFTNIHLFNLAWLGGAAYVDTGRTWYSKSDGPDADNRVLTNVGLGLRFSPSKFRVDRVGHVDIAWPMNEGDNIENYQIILRGSVDF